MHFHFINKKYNSLHTASDMDLVTKNPDALLSEALKAARTNIMYTLSDVEGGKTMLVTSAFSAEGKTSTCINLAATLALTEARVLLVDADLRRPRVHTYLEVKNTTGLANHLGGFCKIEDIVKRTERYDFDFITAGDIPPNPAELLSSKKCAEFVEEVKKHYDYIIFDTPPVNAVADTLSISSSVKHVVFVCRFGVSLIKEVKKAIAALEFAHAKILGFISIEGHTKKRKDYSTYSGYYYK